jgi:hypothetical protein
MQNNVQNFLILSVLLLMMWSIFGTAQAANTLTIGATMASQLEIDVKTATATWALDPATPTYTVTIDKANGVWVRSNKPGWRVTVKTDVAPLTEYDGSTYPSGGLTLKSAMSLSTTDTEGGTGKTIAALSTADQDLWTGGAKGGWKEANLLFSQPVSYDDEPLTNGHTYHAILTFTTQAS